MCGLGGKGGKLSLSPMPMASDAFFKRRKLGFLFGRAVWRLDCFDAFYFGDFLFDYAFHALLER